MLTDEGCCFKQKIFMGAGRQGRVSRSGLGKLHGECSSNHHIFCKAELGYQILTLGVK